MTQDKIDVDSVMNDTITLRDGQFNQIASMLVTSGFGWPQLTTKRLVVKTGDSSLEITADGDSIVVEKTR